MKKRGNWAVGVSEVVIVLIKSFTWHTTSTSLTHSSLPLLLFLPQLKTPCLPRPQSHSSLSPSTRWSLQERATIPVDPLKRSMLIRSWWPLLRGECLFQADNTAGCCCLVPLVSPMVRWCWDIYNYELILNEGWFLILGRLISGNHVMCCCVVSVSLSSDLFWKNSPASEAITTP